MGRQFLDVKHPETSPGQRVQNENRGLGAFLCKLEGRGLFGPPPHPSSLHKNAPLRHAGLEVNLRKCQLWGPGSQETVLDQPDDHPLSSAPNAPFMHDKGSQFGTTHFGLCRLWGSAKDRIKRQGGTTRSMLQGYEINEIPHVCTSRHTGSSRNLCGGTTSSDDSKACSTNYRCPNPLNSKNRGSP